MDCLRARNLALLEDAGEIESGDRDALADHLNSCEACRRHVGDRDAALAAYRRASAPAGLPAGGRGRLLAAVQGEDRQRRILPFAAWASLAAAAVLALALGPGMFDDPATTPRSAPPGGTEETPAAGVDLAAVEAPVSEILLETATEDLADIEALLSVAAPSQTSGRSPETEEVMDLLDAFDAELDQLYTTGGV
jgi:predicted anti-sigma-YlaC factor YlaD